jgi:hypothetical protein
VYFSSIERERERESGVLRGVEGVGRKKEEGLLLLRLERDGGTIDK